MTSFTDTAARCSFSTAALATMGTDSLWDLRLTEYLRLHALTNAVCDFGALARASDASNLEHMRLEGIYGAGWRANPMARAACDATSKAAMAAEAAWTEEYCRPYWQAARDLVLTPAPTLSAALFKVRVIEWDELDNDSLMPRDCFEVVAEDMARLAQPTPEAMEWDALTAEFLANEAAEVTDASIDRAGELLGKIMAMPAPHAAAAKWKLDWLLEDNHGSTASYSSGYVTQAKADYSRFLGGM